MPTDASVDTKLTPEMAQRVSAGASPVAKYFARFPGEAFPLWDEVAAAVFLDPALAKGTTRLAMDIVIDHGATYGATLSWPAGGGPGLGEPDATVVRSVDVPRLEAMFVNLLLRR